MYTVFSLVVGKITPKNSFFRKNQKTKSKLSWKIYSLVSIINRVAKSLKLRDYFRKNFYDFFRILRNISDSGTLLGSKLRIRLRKSMDFDDFSGKSPRLKGHNFRATEPFSKSRHSRNIY